MGFYLNKILFINLLSFILHSYKLFNTFVLAFGTYWTVTIRMNYQENSSSQSSIACDTTSNLKNNGKSYTWTFSAFLKIFLFTLSLTFTPSKAASTRSNVNKKDDSNPTKVCYRGFGCFTNSKPFNPNLPLPQDPNELNTQFTLRTQKYNEDYNITETENIKNSTFDGNKPTKIIIHGFVLTEAVSKWVPTMTKAILEVEDVNVIQANWVDGARTKYDQAVSNTRIVGIQIKKLIRHLCRNYGAKSVDFHLIGFSLGAHVAGFAGKELNASGHKLGRISGLDPANPSFNSDSSLVRLDKSDAEFVDVIHTDIKTILHIATGMNRSLGHVDFWPNAGEDQPGCHEGFMSKGFFASMQDMAICDHLRAHELYIDSISKDAPMIGYKCANYAAFKRGKCLSCEYKHKSRDDSERIDNNRCKTMGYWATPPHGNRQKVSVNYFLDTAKESPFAMHDYQIQIRWRNIPENTPNEIKAKLAVKLYGEYDYSDEIVLTHNGDQYYHLNPNRTAKFLVPIPYHKNLGQLKKIEFKWTAPKCWYGSWFSCNNNDKVYIKRIKLLDGHKRKRYNFVQEERLRHENVHPVEIASEQTVIFHRFEHRHHKNGKPDTTYTLDPQNLVEPPMKSIEVSDPESSENSTTQSSLTN